MLTIVLIRQPSIVVISSILHSYRFLLLGDFAMAMQLRKLADNCINKYLSLKISKDCAWVKRDCMKPYSEMSATEQIVFLSMFSYTVGQLGHVRYFSYAGASVVKWL